MGLAEKCHCSACRCHAQVVRHSSEITAILLTLITVDTSETLTYKPRETPNDNRELPKMRQLPHALLSASSAARAAIFSCVILVKASENALNALSR